MVFSLTLVCRQASFSYLYDMPLIPVFLPLRMKLQTLKAQEHLCHDPVTKMIDPHLHWAEGC